MHPVKSRWGSGRAGEYQDQTQRRRGVLLCCGIQEVHTRELVGNITSVTNKRFRIKESERKKKKFGTKLRVTLRGQTSCPPNTTPSSKESSSSKSVAGAFERLVSRALCDSGLTSIVSFPALLSLLSGRYSTALVLGTRVSHRAARAAMKSAS